jgi:hypothetical protein
MGSSGGSRFWGRSSGGGAPRWLQRRQVRPRAQRGRGGAVADWRGSGQQWTESRRFRTPRSRRRAPAWRLPAPSRGSLNRLATRAPRSLPQGVLTTPKGRGQVRENEGDHRCGEAGPRRSRREGRSRGGGSHESRGGGSRAGEARSWIRARTFDPVLGRQPSPSSPRPAPSRIGGSVTPAPARARDS